MPLHLPLSTIYVPLDESHADVPLDLQSLVTQCHRNGRYNDIDYTRDPEPPLPPEEAAWANARPYMAV